MFSCLHLFSDDTIQRPRSLVGCTPTSHFLGGKSWNLLSFQACNLLHHVCCVAASSRMKFCYCMLSRNWYFASEKCEVVVDFGTPGRIVNNKQGVLWYTCWHQKALTNARLKPNGFIIAFVMINHLYEVFCRGIDKLILWRFIIDLQNSFMMD